MHIPRGNHPLKDDLPEILDMAVDGIYRKDYLQFGRKIGDGIKNSRALHDQHKEYPPKIIDIPEEYV